MEITQTPASADSSISHKIALHPVRWQIKFPAGNSLGLSAVLVSSDAVTNLQEQHAKLHHPIIRWVNVTKNYIFTTLAVCFALAPWRIKKYTPLDQLLPIVMTGERSFNFIVSTNCPLVL